MRALAIRDSYHLPSEYRAALSVLLMGKFGLSKESVASVFGVDPRTVYGDIQRIKIRVVEGAMGWIPQQLVNFRQLISIPRTMSQCMPPAKYCTVTSMSSLIMPIETNR
jgi:hypothetical protein